MDMWNEYLDGWVDEDIAIMLAGKRKIRLASTASNK